MTRTKDIHDELLAIAPNLAGYPAVNPYTVPAGYFDSLADIVLLRIKGEQAQSPREELEAISPLLARLNRSMPYSVPQGYFEQIAAKIPQHTEQEAPARVVRLPYNRVFRYAAAAVIAGVIALTAWFLLEGPVEADRSLVSAKDTPAEPLDKKLENISDTEITSYLESRFVVFPLDNSMPNGELAEADVQLMLEDISDQELEQYLKLNQPAKETFN